MHLVEESENNLFRAPEGKKSPSHICSASLVPPFFTDVNCFHFNTNMMFFFLSSVVIQYYFHEYLVALCTLTHDKPNKLGSQ